MAVCAVCVTAPSASADVPPPVRADLRFASATDYAAAPTTTAAITYDTTTVPVGSRLEVVESRNKWGGMTIDLHADGLLSDRDYRAYVHTLPCGDDPASAGPRLRNGPSQESYEANEVWFRLRTDSHGRAETTTMRYWGIGAEQTANSVIVEYDGAVTACATVPFQRLGQW
ncbi:hypothetical protein [Nocardia bovistercoris]|uniref:Uncharacterized protein n=1 Tax=Nocardia bovistercoris TaxID=2785916 RepID=A0A931IHF9_9NOCA|nr:hypothetical protein [Nocardia bovistercoris]MBH0780450.1 hypothetical protein [Nocardia bovistercoris]